MWITTDELFFLIIGVCFGVMAVGALVILLDALDKMRSGK